MSGIRVCSHGQTYPCTECNASEIQRMLMLRKELDPEAPDCVVTGDFDIDASLEKCLEAIRKRRTAVDKTAIQTMGLPDNDRPTWVDIDHLLQIIDRAKDDEKAHLRIMSGLAQDRDQRDAFGEAEMLLRSWLACMREPRRKDWEEIAANLIADSQKFLDEKGRMVTNKSK